MNFSLHFVSMSSDTRPSIHSCRHTSTTATLFWWVRRKWRLTSFDEWRMLQLVWSPAHTSSTEAYRGYCTLNCTGSMCQSKSRTSCASWCTVACKVKRHSTWSTSANQSPTLLLGSISGPPVDDSWFFRITGCKRTSNELSLLLARRPGTHCLTIWEIRVSPETSSADFWKHICSLCTEASSTSEVLRKCTIQIYYLLLTCLSLCVDYLRSARLPHTFHYFNTAEYHNNMVVKCLHSTTSKTNAQKLCYKPCWQQYSQQLSMQQPTFNAQMLPLWGWIAVTVKVFDNRLGKDFAKSHRYGVCIEPIHTKITKWHLQMKAIQSRQKIPPYQYFLRI